MWSSSLQTPLFAALSGGASLAVLLLAMGCEAPSVDDETRLVEGASGEDGSSVNGGSGLDDNAATTSDSGAPGAETSTPADDDPVGGDPPTDGADANPETPVTDDSAGSDDGSTAAPGQGEASPDPSPATDTVTSTWTAAVTLLGTASADQYGNAVAFDDDGNLYIGGTAYGSFEGVTVYSASDGFLSKYSPTMQHLWTRTVSAIGSQGIEDLVVAGDRVYVCGTTFGNLPGFDDMSPYEGDVFVLAYDLDGHEAWTLQVGTAAEEAGKSLAFAPGEGLYVAGRTTGTLSDPSAFAEDYDALLLKVSLEGALLWQRQWGDDDLDFAHDVIAVPGQGVITVGTTYVAGEDHFDATIARYGSTGTLVWQLTYGGDDDDFADRVARLPSGELLVVGERGSSLGTLAPEGGSDLSFSRFSLGGELLDETLLTATGKAQAHGILVAPTGSTFLGGQTSGCLSAGCDNTELDALVLERDTQGVQGLAWQWGGVQVDWLSALAFYEAAEEDLLVGVGSACQGTGPCDEVGDRQVLVAHFRRATK